MKCVLRWSSQKHDGDQLRLIWGKIEKKNLTINSNSTKVAIMISIFKLFCSELDSRAVFSICKWFLRDFELMSFENEV